MSITIHTTLRHLALVTWAVPAARLSALLPEGLIPATLPGPEGPLGFFSVAVMLEEGMAPRGARFLGLSFPQLNERAYVTRPDGTGSGVLFWRSLVGSPAGLLPRWFLGLPYQWERLSLSTGGGELRFLVREKTAVALSLSRSPRYPPGQTPDPDALRALIANPMIGYSLARGRRLVSFRVEHPPITPRDVEIIEARSEGLYAEEALSPGQAPVYACYTEEAPFQIFLPPQRVLIG